MILFLVLLLCAVCGDGVRVCVVGAGAGGLVASRHLTAAGLPHDVFEASHAPGGIWLYSLQLTDRFGRPSPSAVYKNLRSNVPKQLMEFEGLPHSSNETFITGKVVLDYLNRYEEKFNLKPYIKVGHLVTNISYIENKWEVIVDNLINKSTLKRQYDAVIICNGHFYKARIPSIKGRDEFKGLQMHSKDYRVPDVFYKKTVLIIGLGPSGKDIAVDVSSEAHKVYLSHHTDKFDSVGFKENVISKPDVSSLRENSVVFADGSEEIIDAVLYCTGYHMWIPFLDESTGLKVEDGYVRPLYRHFINIRHPTMALLNLNTRTYIFPLVEAQAKAFVKVLQGWRLPSEEKMMSELVKEERRKEEAGLVRHKWHMVEDVDGNLALVEEVAGLPPLSPALQGIYKHTVHNRETAFSTFRYYSYNILNRNNFSYQLNSHF